MGAVKAWRAGGWHSPPLPAPPPRSTAAPLPVHGKRGRRRGGSNSSSKAIGRVRMDWSCVLWQKFPESFGCLIAVNCAGGHRQREFVPLRPVDLRLDAVEPQKHDARAQRNQRQGIGDSQRRRHFFRCEDFHVPRRVVTFLSRKTQTHLLSGKKWWARQDSNL